ncbi:MAG: hypothetical protein PUD72_02475 [Oscillospiraceae bacterium]|nr:hypothetical protein [Oscillospiraceae bacterium]
MHISKLQIKTDEGKKNVEYLELIQNHGIKGDKKANGGDRQICLADESALLTYMEKNIGLCTKRFMPNITTSGLNYNMLNAGDLLKINSVIIEISSYEKRCFPECSLVQCGKQCEIKNACAFGKVISGGTIKTGDEIFI